jgi:hypothetical protein
VIRAFRSTARRYEREGPGDLVHIDVEKIGKIPDGGGWRANGRGERPGSKRGLDFDYVHSCVDDHSRLANSEILPDEEGPTCAGFCIRAADSFTSTGVTIREMIPNNHMSYKRARDFAEAIATIEARRCCSSRPTALGRTAKSSDSTAPCRSNGSTDRSSTATSNAPQHWTPGWPSTTLNAEYIALGGLLPVADRLSPPDGRVHLAAGAE